MRQAQRKIITQLAKGNDTKNVHNAFAFDAKQFISRVAVCVCVMCVFDGFRHQKFCENCPIRFNLKSKTKLFAQEKRRPKTERKKMGRITHNSY